MKIVKVRHQTIGNDADYFGRVMNQDKRYTTIVYDKHDERCRNDDCLVQKERKHIVRKASKNDIAALSPETISFFKSFDGWEVTEFKNKTSNNSVKNNVQYGTFIKNKGFGDRMTEIIERNNEILQTREINKRSFPKGKSVFIITPVVDGETKVCKKEISRKRKRKQISNVSVTVANNDSKSRRTEEKCPDRYLPTDVFKECANGIIKKCLTVYGYNVNQAIVLDSNSLNTTRAIHTDYPDAIVHLPNPNEDVIQSASKYVGGTVKAEQSYVAEFLLDHPELKGKIDLLYLDGEGAALVEGKENNEEHPDTGLLRFLQGGFADQRSCMVAHTFIVRYGQKSITVDDAINQFCVKFPRWVEDEDYDIKQIADPYIYFRNNYVVTTFWNIKKKLMKSELLSEVNDVTQSIRQSGKQSKEKVDLFNLCMEQEAGLLYT